MDTLPVELLSKIMVDIVYNGDEAGYPAHSWGLQAEDVDNFKDFAEYWLPVHRTKPQAFGPLQLGLVCRQWKHVSEQTAALWNRLAVNLDDVMDSAVAVSKLTDDLSVRLVLSRQAPLHILIVLDSWDRLASGLFTQIFHNVLLSSHRWNSLQMRLPSEHWSILLHGGKAPLSQLKHLSLTNLSLIPTVPKEPLSWQALTHLALEGVDTRDMHMDMTTVTHLRLVDSNLHFPWAGIIHAKRLHHLILDNCGVDTSSSSSSAPDAIVSSSVRHFTYHAPFPAPRVNLLAVLSFPALEEFVLTEDTTSDDSSAGPLAFLSACGRSLRRFVLREDPYNTQPRACAGIVGLLAHLPSAEYLELEFQYVGLSYFDTLFERLASTNEPDGAEFLPNLRALQFNSLHGISWPLLPSIFGPLASTDSESTPTRGHRPLHHLTVKNMSALDSDRLTVDVIDELLALCDRGVEICLFNKENRRIYLEDLG
ncbi:hypothetical protein D9619_008396 [Psilocybe cf. subviscida]|uniref:F-box domain-containing protein n=1 Tax=Psilocybe cf. subviscida TaxID=2480587 RepID=A0A8H5BAH3_9AGAR|nr:hypothetical protein D9619_008396 [Psilocybe cf. subviscida]